MKLALASNILEASCRCHMESLIISVYTQVHGERGDSRVLPSTCVSRPFPSSCIELVCSLCPSSTHYGEVTETSKNTAHQAEKTEFSHITFQTQAEELHFLLFCRLLIIILRNRKVSYGGHLITKEQHTHQSNYDFSDSEQCAPFAATMSLLSSRMIGFAGLDKDRLSHPTLA